MFRRNPDLLAVVAIALYLSLGNVAPAIQLYRDSHGGPAPRERIETFLETEVRAVVQDLVFSIFH